MASSLAKHRYFTFVATSSQMDDAEGIARVIRQRALAALGEVGLGRLDSRVYFHDRGSRVVVVRVARSHARYFKALAGASCRVVACSGSLRTTRPRVRACCAAGAVAAFEARRGDDVSRGPWSRVRLWLKFCCVPLCCLGGKKTARGRTELGNTGADAAAPKAATLTPRRRRPT